MDAKGASHVPPSPVRRAWVPICTVGCKLVTCSVKAQSFPVKAGNMVARTRRESVPQGSMRRVSPCRLAIRALPSCEKIMPHPLPIVHIWT